jgi:hypothetical protein
VKAKVSLVVVGVICLVLGAILATILSVANPFAAKKTATAQIAAGADGLVHETLYIDTVKHLVAATHPGDKPIPTFPSDIPKLSDPALKPSFALLAKVADKSGRIIGFCSEQEDVNADSNILQGKMIMNTTWTVTLPGRGTLFLAEIENASEFARKVVAPALILKREWNEPWTFVTTVGPSPEGRGVIVGGTGEFEGVKGTFVEVTHLKRFTKEKVLMADVELQLAYAK